MTSVNRKCKTDDCSAKVTEHFSVHVLMIKQDWVACHQTSDFNLVKNKNVVLQIIFLSSNSVSITFLCESNIQTGIKAVLNWHSSGASIRSIYFIIEMLRFRDN